MGIRKMLSGAVCVACLLILCVQRAEAQDIGVKAWDAAKGRLTDLVEDRSHDNFATPGTEAQKTQLHQLLDRAVHQLDQSDASNSRDQIHDILDQLRKDRTEISDLKFKRASAPDGVDSTVVEQLIGRLGIGQRSKKDYDSQIASAQARMADHEKALTDAKDGFSQSLAKIGVHLSQAEIDGLMTMATADDFVSMQAAFENMKDINRVLQRAVEDDRESLDVVRRYYGFYVVLLEVAIEMHDNFLEKVSKEYLPKLDLVVKENADLKANASTLYERNPDPQMRAILKSNLASLSVTASAAAFYRDRLIDQENRVGQARTQLGMKHDVAVNTWRTVQNAADLVTMLKGSDQNFEALMSLDIPSLRAFQNLQLNDQLQTLQSITDKMRKTPVS